MVLIKRSIIRAAATLAVVCALGGTALAQSVLNFTTRSQGGVGITNPTSYPAEVKFTLYNEDGSLATTGVLNPVSRRVPGKGQISASYSEIFRMKEGAPAEAWVQATSSVTGLEGFFFSGHSAGSFDTEATSPQAVQTITYISSDAPGAVTVTVTNPSAQSGSVTVTFHDELGREIESKIFSLAAHAQEVFPGRGTSARVSSDVGVLASAIQETGGVPILINGQGERARAQRLVAPYFRNYGASMSTLILSNPSDVDAQVRVSLFADSATVPAPAIVLPRYGSVSMDWRALAGGSDPPPEGWLHVESDAPISGFVLVGSTSARIALPLQSAPADRMLFSRYMDGGGYTSYLNFVGNPERNSIVTVTLSRPDGTTVARSDIEVKALEKVSKGIRSLVPASDDFPRGFVTIQSTAAIYAVEIIDAAEDATDAGVGPSLLPASFQANPVVGAPRIISVVPVELDGRKQLLITGENIDNNPVLYVGGKIVPISPASAGGGQYLADIPPLDPGFVNVKIRVAGMDSNVFSLSVAPEGASYVPRNGVAMFQKVEVTESGLDLSRTVIVPIRNARVEVIDRVTRQVLTVAETDDAGAFVAAVPDRPGLAIQVVSRLRSYDVRILDNTQGNRLYSIRKDLDDPADTSVIEIIDTSRVSGAFNILDAIQRANMMVAIADAQLLPSPLTIYWSEKNNESVLSKLTGGLIRTTFFNASTNTAYVLGDRTTDSDEFDDSVILHEYAHLLAARFSRDDSRGGPHLPGDMLDPRVAWSEGWANFFSSAVRLNPIFIDSKGLGAVGIRFDLEENVPGNDRPGYRSEASVQGLLWDLFDEVSDNGDSVQFPIATIWKAFTELRSARFVYLPHFLERFLEKNQGVSDALRTMVVLRSIDFQPDVRPSVVTPFPMPIAVGETKQGGVDSFTSKRTNLASSAHFYSFTTQMGGQAVIRLDIEGVGSANNPNANDLDLYLYDANGKLIDQSARWLNGQAEFIYNITLAPGAYYVEVRSFYTNSDNAIVYNSGKYRLTVQIFQ